MRLPCIDALTALDADIGLVFNNSSANKRRDVVQFLESRATDQLGRWYGGLFDVWMKATALRSGLSVRLDHALSSGRDHDICLQQNGREFHFEGTVITQDDEARDVWDRYLADKKHDPDKVLIRPGAYCPKNAKGPSPYYDALRLYAKIYDKIAKDLDPSKTQFVDGEPNVLLISFAGIGLSADSPSIGWVLDELFADQPRMVQTIAADGLTDISLAAWIDFNAKDRISRGKMTVDFYCAKFGEIMSAPRRIAGVLLFEGASLVEARLNYNAHDSCKMSHREMADLANLFRQKAAYWM